MGRKKAFALTRTRTRTRTCTLNFGVSNNTRSTTTSPDTSSHALLQDVVDDDDDDDDNSSCVANKPRNLLITDATSPLTFSFPGRFGTGAVSLTVHQTPDDETWPGGVLWDLGLLLSQVLVAVAMMMTTPNRKDGNTTTTTTAAAVGGKTKVKNNTTRRTIQLPSRLVDAILVRVQASSSSSSSNGGLPAFNRASQCSSSSPPHSNKHPTKTTTTTTTTTILELGCGVGLTGLVATAVFPPPVVTVLTDLDVVIQKVTRPNVERNTTTTTRAKSTNRQRQQQQTQSSSFIRLRTINKGQNRVIAQPLCWGCEKDEQTIRTLLQQQVSSSSSSSSSTTAATGMATKHSKGIARKKKIEKANEDEESNNATTTTTTTTTRTHLPPPREQHDGIPDIVLIGDVAYQQKPGAPSHFDALLSTLLKFTDPHTLVIFGTRIRMPASHDLLHMLLEEFDEQIQPPVSAEEIDPQLFAGVKHNMSIHFLKRKQQQQQQQACVRNGNRA